MGSLYEISKPVIGVFGTSPRQGKFNLQLDIRRRFLDNGYIVGQLGTEPTSWLFGMDIEFHNGYESRCVLSGEKTIYYLNQSLANLQECDVVVVGAQSNVVPCSTKNLGFSTFSQQYILYATTPDLVILCINVNDDPDYIVRTIDFIYGCCGSKVIALCIYPFIKDFEWDIQGANVAVNDSILDTCKSKFSELTGLPVYVNGQEQEMKEMFELCIDLLT